MTDVSLAHPDDYPELNGARYRSARLRRLHARRGRVMGPDRDREPVPLTDPLADLWDAPAEYPESER